MHIIRAAPILDLYVKSPSEQPGDKALGSYVKADFPRGPVRHVHLDYSAAEAPRLVAKHYPDDAARLLRGRFQIINLWRPIRTVYKDPFAVVDATTALEEELVPLAVVRPDYSFESVNVRAPLRDRTDGGHRWYYMSAQTPEDVLLFKIFDSEVGCKARRAPHSSFPDQEFENMGLRASIEARAMVFYGDERESRAGVSC